MCVYVCVFFISSSTKRRVSDQKYKILVQVAPLRSMDLVIICYLFFFFNSTETQFSNRPHTECFNSISIRKRERETRRKKKDNNNNGKIKKENYLKERERESEVKEKGGWKSGSELRVSVCVRCVSFVFANVSCRLEEERTMTGLRCCQWRRRW